MAAPPDGPALGPPRSRPPPLAPRPRTPLAASRFWTTNLISGLMFVAIGFLFIAFEGTSGLERLYSAGGATDLALSAQRWAEAFSQKLSLLGRAGDPRPPASRIPSLQVLAAPKKAGGAQGLEETSSRVSGMHRPTATIVKGCVACSRVRVPRGTPTVPEA